MNTTFVANQHQNTMNAHELINEARKRVSDLNETHTKQHDPVHQPSHYNQGKIECIEAIEAATTNLKGIEAFCTGNAIKYLWRWKQKNKVQDLEKAKWYIEKLIQNNK